MLKRLNSGQWRRVVWKLLTGQQEDDPFRKVEECQECFSCKILPGVAGLGRHNTD